MSITRREELHVGAGVPARVRSRARSLAGAADRAFDRRVPRAVQPALATGLLGVCALLTVLGLVTSLAGGMPGRRARLGVVATASVFRDPAPATPAAVPK